MHRIYGIAPPANGWYKPAKPERNPAYLRFIRRQPCAICSSTRAVEAAHTGPHGIGQKASDYSAVPLCRKCHQTGRESYHKQARTFFLLHGVDVDSLTQELRKAFKETKHHV
jgi:hypothetical protein